VYGLLRGIRVVEASAFVAGPSCALYLAQMGAEVIRIDQIGGGPDFNRWPLSPESGSSLYWEGLNKSKKSIALDLRRPEGRELALQIITAPGENAGMLVTNYPVEGFLAYQHLASRRPDLICVRVMGWPDGRPAVDYTVNAAVGVPAMTGPPEDPRPVNHVLPAWDLLTGAYAAFTLVSAAHARAEDGRGRDIRIALSDVAIATLGHLGQVAEVVTRGTDRPKVGNALYGAFGRDFHTADGHRLMVVAITPRQWSGLLAALDLSARVGALETKLGVRFDQHEGARFEHRDQLIPLIADAIQRRAAADLIAAFEAHSVCWSRYQTLHEAIAKDPYFSAANPILSSVAHQSGHEYLTPGASANIVSEPREATSPAPRLGRDTDEVLRSVLELSSDQIAGLHDDGLVA